MVFGWTSEMDMTYSTVGTGIGSGLKMVIVSWKKTPGFIPHFGFRPPLGCHREGNCYSVLTCDRPKSLASFTSYLTVYQIPEVSYVDYLTIIPRVNDEPLLSYRRGVGGWEYQRL